MARKPAIQPKPPAKRRDTAPVIVSAPRTVASAGSRLETLEAVRAVLAKQLDDAGICKVCNLEVREPPAAKAALAKELRAVLSEIETLKVPEVTNAVDDLAKAREARIAAAHVAGSSVRRVRQR
jgi:hypothetical protein